MSESVNPYESYPSYPEPKPPFAIATPVSDAITVEGALTAKEALQAVKMLRAGRFTFWLAIAAIGCGGLFMAATIINRLVQGAPLSRVVFPAVVIAFLVLVLMLPRWRVRRWAASGKGICAPHRRIIDDRGVATEMAATNIQQTWKAFQRVRHKKGVLLLYLVDHPKVALVFGRSMFEDDIEWRNFIELAERKVSG
jgi:hypothetical protein